MGYCNKKGIWCDNTTEFGYCQTTGCINPKVNNFSTIITNTIPNSDQMCGNCHNNDGLCYGDSIDKTVKYRCSVTGRMHLYTDKCDIKPLEMVKAEESPISIKSEIIRRCEICNNETENPEYHICAKCRLKLHDLLYKDNDYGRGTWC